MSKSRAISCSYTQTEERELGVSRERSSYCTVQRRNKRVKRVFALDDTKERNRGEEGWEGGTIVQRYKLHTRRSVLTTNV